MQLVLTRDAPRIDCQEGVLNVGSAQYYTMERLWLDDQPDVSCVPRGTYDLVPHVISHGPLSGLACYALSNADLGVFPEPPDNYTGANPVRVACLIHPANWAFQLEGCIAPGKARGLLAPSQDSPAEPAVLQSRGAFDEIMQTLGTGQSGHSLIIR